MADLVRVELTREEAEQIDQLGSGRIFVIASQREAAERVRAKARAALDTPQPESGGVEEARLADLFDSVEDAAYIRGAIERGKSPEAEAIQLLRKFMCCKAGRDWVLVGLIQPFAHAFTQPPQVGLSAEERERPNVLSAEEAKAIVDCYFNEEPDRDPEPIFTRLGEWADEQLAALADQKGEGS